MAEEGGLIEPNQLVQLQVMDTRVQCVILYVFLCVCAQVYFSVIRYKD